MDVVFENIPSLLVFTILFLVVYAVLLNIYFIRRNGLQISVNCWFCNKNSKVLYSKRNSFNCPFCSQYNGFNKKGDYNKVIEAQHNISLNNANKTLYQKIGSSPTFSANGLCNSCNKNQQLKIVQLANYEPLNEKNYVAEIEHFEIQLEKTYKLCKSCTKTVENTIRRQNAWIFGNRLKSFKNFNVLKKKGLSYLNLNRLPQEYLKDKKFNRSISFVRLLLLTLSALNLVCLAGFDNYVLKNFIPSEALPSNVIFTNIYSTIYNITVTNLGHQGFTKYLPKIVEFQKSSLLPISLIGLMVDTIFTLFESCTFFGKCNKFLSWTILGLISTIQFKEDLSSYVNTLQIFCSLWLTYTYGVSCFYVKEKRLKKYKLKKLSKSVDNEESSHGEDSSSECANNSKVIGSYQNGNQYSPNLTTANNSLNRTFESVKPTRTSSVLNHNANNGFYNEKNIGLNKHFNELNLGAFHSSRPTSQSFMQRPVSPNPFLLHGNIGPQSPNYLFNNGSYINSANTLFPMRSPISCFQNTYQNYGAPSSLGHIASASSFNNLSNSFLPENNTSPGSIRSESHRTQLFKPFSPMANSLGGVLNSPFAKQVTTPLPQNNRASTVNYNKDSMVIQRSPTYSLRSQSDQSISSPQKNINSSLSNTFRPLSPVTTMERPSRLFMSPPKLNNIKTFHSDSRENENLSLSFHTESLPSSNIWPNISGSNLHQRFVVNTLSDMQHSSSTPLNINFGCGHKPVKNGANNSRSSSSSSSGFISNSDLAKIQTRSLPGSREHSPDRNSLLSEPAYHFKID